MHCLPVLFIAEGWNDNILIFMTPRGRLIEGRRSSEEIQYKQFAFHSNYQSVDETLKLNTATKADQFFSSGAVFVL